MAFLALTSVLVVLGLYILGNRIVRWWKLRRMLRVRPVIRTAWKD